MKELPPNFAITWHRGDFSLGELYTNSIVAGFPKGGTYKRVEYLRNEREQLPEDQFSGLFLRAIALCGLRPDLMVTIIRNDREREVPENENNRPFIMESSPRYTEGAEVKDIEYEGYRYHSDPSVIKRFDEEYMRMAEKTREAATEQILPANKRTLAPDGHIYSRTERKHEKRKRNGPKRKR